MDDQELRSLMVWKRIVNNERVSNREVVEFLRGFMGGVTESLESLKKNSVDLEAEIRKNREYITQNRENDKILYTVIREIEEKLGIDVGEDKLAEDLQDAPQSD